MKRWIVPLAIVAAALGAGFGGGYWYAHSPGTASPGDALPVVGRAPHYRLTNQLGDTVDSSAFAGKVQVVTFLFPYCTDYCPLIAAHLKSAAKALSDAGLADRVVFVAFNVDPEDTGTKVMARFLKEYGWDPTNTRMQFLTGKPEEIRKVVTGGFGVDYQKVPESLVDKQERIGEQHDWYTPPPEVKNRLAREAKPDYDVTHNDALVLVDTQGRIRKVFQEADRISDDQLVDAVRRLLAGGR